MFTHYLHLFLNKIRVDTYDNSIVRNIRISEVTDISQRNSSYSYTLKLPLTPRNRQVFDMLAVAGNQSRKPYELIEAAYEVEGIFIIEKGFAVIRETSNGYNVNVIDGIKSLTEILGEKTIADLPLADLNHILTEQAFVDSWENEEGYIYGLANFGGGSTVFTVFVEKNPPSLFLHTISIQCCRYSLNH